MAQSDTVTRILDTAEVLFAERGFAETSLRNITSKARVNLAAVNYHFGSKEGLVRAVYGRRLGPLNDERLRRLDAAEAGGADAADLEAVVEAFVAPALRLHRSDGGGGPESFAPLVGRVFFEPGEEMEPILSQFAEIRRRFVPAFQRSLPHLSRQDLLWRLHFTIGALCHTAFAGGVLEHLSGGLCDAEDVDEAARQLVHFIAAGLRAPAPGGTA